MTIFRWSKIFNKSTKIKLNFNEFFFIRNKKVKFLRSIHTTPEKFGNPFFFPRLGLPFTLIRHENAAFQKLSSNRRPIWKRRLSFFMWTENVLKTALFEGNRYHGNQTISLPNFYQTQIPQNDRWLLCHGFKFLQRRVEGLGRSFNKTA